ncbi:Stk1 family PASTA domain-containing Ser/Thr kinase [Fodinisporobacter ferrooxydans]|uniref:non-specific serine/threonine protein kinase n=1 Tax=Fodinisporobacter ferrooxydans TaxID=2901836 RepID=A0ABY4CFZ1_9BACL|nr:Stk1 family PASTA domain-containing Ser/Thr kinase [Alicyclobacillaceae bacterium MYW30-H2]
MIGRKLGNRYEVEERLGGGGMAVVYRGVDTLLNRNVSIKVLRSQFAGDEEFVYRFRREAQAAASLSHPNIVNIYDVGTDDEDHFIVMEYIDGCTLKEKIESLGALQAEEAVRIAKQICDALEHAHAHNIVHRDIKPHNILISKDGRVKVTDFGIARAITSDTITHNDSSVLGSVHYFSPEQARGGLADVKSDLYSLGVVLYEMVTGQVPFSGDTPVSIALKHLQESFVEPRMIKPSIPQSVENIILRALLKDPLQRYQSARELYRDLDRAFIQPNMPKFLPPEVRDDQATIQVPPVFDSQRPRFEGKEGHGSPLHTEPKKPMKQRDEKKGKKFWRPVIWLFVILVILIIGSIGGYKAYSTFFNVPTIVVPNVIGKTYDQAVTVLENAGFQPTQIHETKQADNKTPANQVMKQDPDKDMSVKQGRDIYLTVSTGPQQVNLPDVTGKQQAEALQMLEDAGISADKIKTVNQTNDQVAKGTVISMNPAAGSVSANTTVTLYVSAGVASVAVPDVTGKTYDDAINTLQQAGFVPNIVQSPSFTVKQNMVIKTDPAANQNVQKGSKVNVTVSSGYPSDAHEVAVDINIKVDPTKVPMDVLITYTDPRGTDQQAVKQQITKDTTFTVHVYTLPNQAAAIKVYENGKLTNMKTIPYQ